MDNRKEIRVTNRFDDINKNFLKQIESLRETLPLVMIFITANDSKANKDFADFVKKKGVKTKDEEGEETFTFSQEDSHQIVLLEKNASISSTALEIIPKSLFVSLISQFDSYLGNLIREIFQAQPEILNSSEKNLSFSKLLEIKNLDEAKEFIIEKEVESILRESHTDHFDWLENKLKIPLRKDLPIWQTFIEITERRNLFVHCDGVVSSQYLTNCRAAKVPFEKEPSLGESLAVNPDYFEKAFRCLFEVSVKLTQVVWRKLLPNDLEKADESLNDICFELLRSHQYDLCDILLDFATTILKKHYNEESKNVFIVNKALSLKLGGHKEKSYEIIAGKDWSACSDKFKIAKEALLENFSEVEKLMRKIGSDGEIKKISYKTWPLFEEFRKTEGFLTTFKEVFGEDYALVETPKKLLEQIVQQALKADKKKKEYQKELEEQKTGGIKTDLPKLDETNSNGQ